MFQFTRFASAPYVFRCRYPCGRVSPFRNLRINAHLPTPRSLSQAFTSFVAYHRQGIHHMLLFTWPYNFDFFHKNSKSIKERSIRFDWLTRSNARYAVMWIFFQIPHQRAAFSWERFVITWIQTKFKFVLTQSKCHQRHGCICMHFLWQRWFRLYELLKNSQLIPKKESITK